METQKNSIALITDFSDRERSELIIFFYEKITQSSYARKTENLFFNAFLSNAKLNTFESLGTDLQTDEINTESVAFNLNILRNLFTKISVLDYAIEEGVIKKIAFRNDLSLFANLFAEVYKQFYAFVEYEYHLDYQIQMDISAAEFNTISNFISEKLFWNERDTQHFCQELKANFGK